MRRPIRITRGASLLLLALLTLAACSGEKEWSARLDAIIGETDLSAEQQIESLQDYLDEGPPDAEANRARFMIGWHYSESLKQYGEARAWFTRVVEEDPDGEYAQDSRWMIQNMDKDPADLLPGLLEKAAGEKKEEASPPPARRKVPDPSADVEPSRPRIPPISR